MTLAELAWMPGAQAVAVAVVGFLLANRIVMWAKLGLRNSDIDPAVRDGLSVLLRPLLYGVVATAALERLGVQTEGLLTLVAGASLAVGLGLREVLNALVAGAILLTTRPFAVGDLVVVSNQEGRVLSFGLIETVIERLDGTVVTLRNDLVLAMPVQNHERRPNRRIDIDASVGWGTHLPAACAEALRRISALDHAHKEPAPRVDIEALPNTGPVLRVRVWVDAKGAQEARAAIAAELAAAIATVGGPRPTT